VNYNLSNRNQFNDADYSLFPSQITQEEIEEQIQKAPDSVKKILQYYLLVDSENKYEEAKFILESFYKNKEIPIEKIKNPIVYKVIKTTRSIRRQIHKLMGLLRFHEVEGGYLYAPFTSDFDVIIPLSLHFAWRFPSERLIIHDIKREKAVFVEEGDLFEVVFHSMLPSETEDETFFQQLWKMYHQNISIQERENKKLQRHNLPIKFQHWLIEFEKQYIQGYLFEDEKLRLFYSQNGNNK